MSVVKSPAREEYVPVSTNATEIYVLRAALYHTYILELDVDGEKLFDGCNLASVVGDRQGTK